MTMFGRDSIFTSLQALPFTPELAATTLRALGELAGHPRRRLPRRGSGPDPPRDALRRDDRVRGAAALALLRLRRRDAALRRAARRVRALDRRPQARARPRARGARGAQLDRRVRRPHGQRLHLVPAPQRGDRPREPVLEGLLGLDLLPRRPAARLPAGDLRAPGLRLRREGARRPAGAARSGRTRRSPTGWRSEAADLKRRFNRDFWVEDGEYFALALDTDGNQVDALTSNNGHLLWSGIVDKSKAEGGRRAPARAAALLRLGRAHAGRGRGALQPDRLPRRHRLAVRQLVHRLGPAALRLQGGGGADRRRDPRRGRVLRRPPARGVRRLRPRR